MRGRKPEPTKMRLARGNPSRLPVNENEPAPIPLDSSDAPTDMTKAQQKVWLKIVPLLKVNGVLSQTDIASIRRYCELTVTYNDCLKSCNKAGVTQEQETRYGIRTLINPAFNAMNKAATQLLRLEQEFGLTPASRTKVRADKTQDNKALGRYTG